MIPAKPGDFTLHYGDGWHTAPPPQRQEHSDAPYRSCVLVSFEREGAFNHRGERHYNDVLLGHEDGQVDHLAKLHFAGRLVCQARHPEGLQAMVNGFFGLPARIEEFVGAWMTLPEDRQCRLGESPETGALGVNAVAGARIWGYQQKFRIVLGPMNFSTYRRLLPGGESLERLVALVRNYTGDELAWEVNMVLKRDEVPSLKLGEGGRLGWTTWLGDRRASEDADDLVLNAMAYVG